MDIQLLNPADQETVCKLERQSSNTAKYSITLGSSVEDWRSFAEEVERGYKLGLEDYVNALTKRISLEEIMTALSDEGQKSLTAILQPIDDRYTSATREINKSLYGVNAPKEQWWLFRVPLRGDQELMDDLMELGFVNRSK